MLILYTISTVSTLAVALESAQALFLIYLIGVSTVATTLQLLLALVTQSMGLDALSLQHRRAREVTVRTIVALEIAQAVLLLGALIRLALRMLI
jgi:hypothetical protein